MFKTENNSYDEILVEVYMIYHEENITHDCRILELAYCTYKLDREGEIAVIS